MSKIGTLRNHKSSIMKSGVSPISNASSPAKVSGAVVREFVVPLAPLSCITFCDFSASKTYYTSVSMVQISNHTDLRGQSLLRRLIVKTQHLIE